MPVLPDTRQVFYRMWDTAQPRANVVFLHGAGEHSGLYHRFAAALNADGYRVWAIDHIAHGLTPGRPEEVYAVSNLAENARRLMQVVEQHDKTLKTVLIGNSLGGVTAGLLLCRADAPKVAGLLLASTPLAPLADIDRLDEVVMSLEPTYLDELEFDPLKKQMEDLDYYKLDAGMTAAAKQMEQAIGSWDFPVLFLNGENDSLAPPEIAQRWAVKMRYGRAVTIQNGHHDILNDTAYAEVARLVCNFVFETTCEQIQRFG